jgi:hypothetical protein
VIEKFLKDLVNCDFDNDYGHPDNQTIRERSPQYLLHKSFLFLNPFSD